MRQIVLDTETTGIGAEAGHRIIEIACIELIDRELTGKHFHQYLNPQRKIDEGAFRVHGISETFLQDKPLFGTIVDDFMRFIEGSELIIHNAPFDLAFLNAELKKIKWPTKIENHCCIVDTLVLARKKHPGQRNNLDALCKRYDIDNSSRQYHGALLDSEILAGVYLAMTGGQGCLFASESPLNTTETKETINKQVPVLSAKTPLIYPSSEEAAAHAEFIEFLVKKSKINRWKKVPEQGMTLDKK